MNAIDLVESRYVKPDMAVLLVGDTVKVHINIVEGGKKRIQVFEGLVIAKKGGGSRETFTVRKISSGIGVEKVFPLYSPMIARLEVVRHGDVRRAKLYYLRDRVGTARNVKEKREAK